MRGASTISQQVAKNLFLWSGRSWVRKGIEAWYTVLIEAMWPKARILEVYANIAEFGDGIYGAQAAARSYWRKDASRLSLAESARLAAVLPAPEALQRGPARAVTCSAARNWIERQVRQIGGTGLPADDCDLKHHDRATHYDAAMTRDLTIVVAACNEAEALPALHPRIAAVLDALHGRDRWPRAVCRRRQHRRHLGGAAAPRAPAMRGFRCCACRAISARKLALTAGLDQVEQRRGADPRRRWPGSAGTDPAIRRQVARRLRRRPWHAHPSARAKAG